MRIFPGLTLNLSRQGISTTVGVPGLSVNKNKKGTFLNLGIPGTGIYNRVKLEDEKKVVKKLEPKKIEVKPKRSIKELEDLLRELKKPDGGL